MIKAMKDFQIPMRVEVDKDTQTQTFGRFTTEAYERGFGTTVGNALRRVLLSALTGAAGATGGRRAGATGRRGGAAAATTVATHAGSCARARAKNKAAVAESARRAASRC